MIRQFYIAKSNPFGSLERNQVRLVSLAKFRCTKGKVFEILEVLTQIVVPPLLEPDHVVVVEETGDERHHQIRSIDDGWSVVLWSCG